MSKTYKTYYDVSRFVLWADNPSEEGKRARFVLSFRDGNPRFVVYTGGLGADSIINFPMDVIHLTTAMNTLKDVADGENGSKIYIESSAPIYDNDRPTGNNRVLATLVIGKSKDGIVYLSILCEGRPNIVFPISPSNRHIFRDSNKEIISNTIISRTMAISIANIILDAVARVMIDYTNEEYDNGGRKPTPIKNVNAAPDKSKVQAPQFSDLDDIL